MKKLKRLSRRSIIGQSDLPELDSDEEELVQQRHSQQNLLRDIAMGKATKGETSQHSGSYQDGNIIDFFLFRKKRSNTEGETEREKQHHRRNKQEERDDKREEGEKFSKTDMQATLQEKNKEVSDLLATL